MKFGRHFVLWILSLLAAITLAAAGAMVVLAEGEAVQVAEATASTEPCPTKEEIEQMTAEELALVEDRCFEEAGLENPNAPVVPPATVEEDPNAGNQPPAQQQPAQAANPTPAATPTPSAAPKPAKAAKPSPTKAAPAKPKNQKPDARPTRKPAPKAAPKRKGGEKPAKQPRKAERHEGHAHEAPADARLFRDSFEPNARIPELPSLDLEIIKQLAEIANAHGVKWSQLAAVSWLESRWGDPTAGGFAGQHLTEEDWATYGADGNADGETVRTQRADQLATIAAMLAKLGTVDNAKDEFDVQTALAEYFDEKPMARRAKFLSAYYHALGRLTIREGLEQARERLSERVLNDSRITIYDGGRSDIEAGVVDPRVLVTLRFLANRFGQVTVSSLVSGHGVFTSSGNVSLHSYGQAVDIAVLDDTVITGAEQADKHGVTVNALKDILLMPKSVQPNELISLWELGGPSFAMPDHADHIHVGWN